MEEKKIPIQDLETMAFDEWADANCEHNKFYECSHPDNPEKYCMDCNCPIREKFFATEEYKEIWKNEDKGQ